MALPLPQMKDALKKVYRGSQQWQDKVDAMKRDQIVAIYHRFVQQKLIKV